MYSSDVKKCAQQIVKEFFNEILIGEFRVPSQMEMESYLLESIDYAFDEYQTIKRIQRSHTQWGEERITEELEKQKRRYEKDFRSNMSIAAQNAVNEVENLVRSLKYTIKAWKLKNL